MADYKVAAGRLRLDQKIGVVLERLSADLKREFPEMWVFSKTNLKYMRRFAKAYPQIGEQAVPIVMGPQHRALDPAKGQQCNRL